MFVTYIYLHFLGPSIQNKLIGEINISTEDIISLPIRSSPEEKADPGLYLGTIEVNISSIQIF